MKILLIFPPRKDDSYIFPPTSLLYIAQAARAAGHEAEIVDIPYLLEKFPDKYSLLDGSLFDYILHKKFDCLGLGGVVSTYFFYEYFVKKVRAHKNDIPIIAGGSVGLPIKDIWARYAPVDYLVEGDGERVIQQFLNYLEKRDRDSVKKIPGIYCLENGSYKGNPQECVRNIDEIPFLDYDEIDVEYYLDALSRWVEDALPDRNLIKYDKLRILPLLTSRGCPFNCTFCFHFNRLHRAHSVDYVMENIKFLKNKYGINVMYIIDDLFNFDRDRTIELCERIYGEKLGVYFFAGGGKPSLVTAEMLKSMKKAGFIRFSYGIESGSQKILDIMQKKTTVAQNYNALKLAKENNVPYFANMVIGMPGENIQTLKETKKFLIDAGLSTKDFYASWAVAYPGTPLFEWMRKNGMVSDTHRYLFEVGSFGKYVYNFSELPEKELNKRVYLLHHEVDMAYYLKHRKYIRYLKKVFLLIAANIFFMIKVHPEIKNFLKVLRKKMFPLRQKRIVKQSSVEIEKWVQSLKMDAVPAAEERKNR